MPRVNLVPTSGPSNVIMQVLQQNRPQTLVEWLHAHALRANYSAKMMESMVRDLNRGRSRDAHLRSVAEKLITENK